MAQAKSYHSYLKRQREEDTVCENEAKRYKQADAEQRYDFQTSSIPPEIWNIIVNTMDGDDQTLATIMLSMTDLNLCSVFEQNCEKQLIGRLDEYGKQHTQQFSVRKWICSASASKGYIDLLETALLNLRSVYMYYQSYKYCEAIESFVQDAFRDNQLEVLKFLVPLNPEHRGRIIIQSSNSSVECMKYLRDNGYSWDERTCSSAALYGNIKCLKYATENHCPKNEKTCSKAASIGHLDVIKYAHQNGFPWDSLACSMAAEGGHLEVLKYLHENGCPWDETVCCFAAEYGQLDVLKYLHENGCPWDEMSSLVAAYSGHLEVLKYLHENGCPWSGEICLKLLL